MACVVVVVRAFILVLANQREACVREYGLVLLGPQ
jgi:hypothetical protein